MTLSRPQESDGDHNVRGSKAPSKTGTLEGPDVEVLEEEEMDEGKVKAMPSALPPIVPRKATPKKDDTYH